MEWTPTILRVLFFKLNIMTQLEKFSLHFPYKPSIEHTIYDAFGDIVSIEKGYSLTEHNLSFVNSMDYWFDDENECEIKPYLRSFDQLTKECVQADYNDGKPFVPAKLFLREIGINYPIECYNQDLNWILREGFEAIKHYPFEKVQQLLKWHFAVGFEKGEYIEVTNENNPY